ncbi:MAG TPA: beta-ketoacyl-ACP synthase III [Fibrobacteria bacterium]|nr:beta-ketoacyl-ACP synthase III [Fibrobacteria bacterium]
MGAVIRGIGVHYPESVITNADLEKMVETTDEWISTRTGIKQRRILPKGSPLKSSDFGAYAAGAALEKAGLSALDIDGIICANINPDKQFPATACFIQAKIGAANAFAFDVTAACAGFVYAANMAALLIDAGQCRHILVIGSEIISPVLDWTDRNTCILFGDAAGAVVFSAGPKDRGILLSQLKSDGTQSEMLYLNNPGDEGRRGMFMDGKHVFKAAVTEITDIVRSTLDKAGFAPKDLDLLIMHQANVRIIGAIAEKLELPPEKVVINVDRFGNTSSASIPLALHEAQGQGRLEPGMLIAFAAVGGGMSWGCNLMRW